MHAHLTSVPNKSEKTMLSVKIPELYKAIFRTESKKENTGLHKADLRTVCHKNKNCQ